MFSSFYGKKYFFYIKLRTYLYYYYEHPKSIKIIDYLCCKFNKHTNSTSKRIDSLNKNPL